MFLDIGVGILLAIFVSKLFSLPLTASFLIGGIVFSLLVDIDYIFHPGRKETPKSFHKHRNLFHFPLLYIPLGMLIILFFNLPWAILFGLCSLAHFLHDSIGIGWGIQWLYPFSKNHYAFFYEYQPPYRKEKLPKKIIYVWKHKDIDKIEEKYGDKDWIRDIYLHCHPYAIVEFLVFILALIILYFYIK